MVSPHFKSCSARTIATSALVFMHVCALFKATEATATSFTTCRSVMEQSSEYLFESLADVEIFMHAHEHQLRQPDKLAVRNYLTSKLNFRMPLKKSELDAQTGLERGFAVDTLEALQMLRETQWDQQAAFIAANYIEYWAVLMDGITKYKVRDQKRYMRNIKLFVNVLAAFRDKPIDEKSRRHINTILEAYYTFKLQTDSQKFWEGVYHGFRQGDHREFPVVLSHLQKSIEYLSAMSEEESWKSGEEIRPFWHVYIVTSILFEPTFFKSFVLEQPKLAKIVLLSLEKLQRMVEVFADTDYSSKFKLKILFKELDNRLLSLSDAVKMNPRVHSTVEDIREHIPQGALRPSLSRRKIYEILKSAYVYQGYNAILHGRLESKIKSYLRHLEFGKDEELKQVATWFLHHVINELHAQAAKITH